MLLRLILLLVIYAPCLAQYDAGTAQRLFDSGKFAEAKQGYLQLLKKEPANTLYLERLGDISSQASQWKQSSGYYKRFRDLDPGNANAHYKYGGALSMIAAQSGKLTALGMIGEIKASFEKAIVLEPTHVQARWALVEYYLQVPGILGGSESKATEYANQLLPLSPVDHYLARGRIEEYFGRLKKAEVQFVKAHAVGNSKITREKLNGIRLKMKHEG